MRKEKLFGLTLTVILLTTVNALMGQSKTNLYSNGDKFKVLRYIFTDLNEKIIDRNDNIKQTMFIIDSDKKLFTVKMGTIYNEYYYYNKVDRITINGKTRDIYGIYKSYSTENKDKSLTDVLTLELNPTTNELKSYQLFFGDKGFITFYLSPAK
jgi:hypothetical protein